PAGRGRGGTRLPAAGTAVAAGQPAATLRAAVGRPSAPGGVGEVGAGRGRPAGTARPAGPRANAARSRGGGAPPARFPRRTRRRAGAAGRARRGTDPPAARRVHIPSIVARSAPRGGGGLAAGRAGTGPRI